MASSAMASSPPEAAPGSRLFRIRRTFSLGPHQRIVAMAAHSLEKRQLLALALSSSASSSSSSSSASSSATRDDPHAHVLLVRSVEEDGRVRHWRFPLAVSRTKQQQQRAEPVAALAFAPDGDWLACLSTRKTRLHLVPVATLIAGHRRTQLACGLASPPHNREWMGVAPSVMTAPMASYLRATNEAGGLNGARFRSRVAGDDTQMSTLEFAAGMGTLTCCCWWRSMNGADYCLVGGTDGLISIVNVRDNAEECRCELQSAGAIESIELFYESFRKEKRTSMLVKTRVTEAVGTTSGKGTTGNKGSGLPATAVDGSPSTSTAPTTTTTTTIKYYRVVLEKKTMVAVPKQSDSDRATASTATTTTTTTTNDNDPSSAATPAPPSFQRFVPRPASAERVVVKTFPEHFVEDMDFRPQRIKKTKPDVRLGAINGLLARESALVMLDATSQRVSVYSNFQWSLKGQYAVPALGGDDQDQDDRLVDVDVAYCSSDLLLLQGTNATTGANVATWLSLPSRHAGALLEDATTTTTSSSSSLDAEAHAVHMLSLHDNERVERVLQTRSSGHGNGSGSTGGSGSGSSDATDPSGGEVIYVLQTAHHVYECRPQWSRLALFRALRARAISLRDALSIGYALGIDMPSLCEVVADTLCTELLEANDDTTATDVTDVSGTRQWLFDLYEVSRARPSKAVTQLTRIGGATLALTFAQRVLDDTEPTATFHGFAGDAGDATHEQQTVALLAAELVCQQQAQHSFHAPSVAASAHDHVTLRPRDAATQRQLEHHDAWLRTLLTTARHAAFATGDMLTLCLRHHKIEYAVAVAIARNAVPLLLQRLVAHGLAPTLALPTGARSIDALLAAGWAGTLLAPAHRVVLRALPLTSQLDVLLATASPDAVLVHRDWLVRHLAALRTDACVRLATLLDPTASVAADAAKTTATATADDGEVDDGEEEGEEGEEDEVSGDSTADVASSEGLTATPAERVELFLTLLLRLNRHDHDNDNDNNDDHDNDDDDDIDGTIPPRFAQTSLESLLRELAAQYRPPILVARCVDYQNWNAAASLYEAHGELVDAVECRLQSHQRLLRQHRDRDGQRSSRPRRHSSKESLAEEHDDDDDAGNDDNDDNDEPRSNDLAPLRTELLAMVDALVVKTPSPAESMRFASSSFTSSSSRARTRTSTSLTDTTRAAILARLLVKWFEYGLARAPLEVFLIDPTVFGHVAAPLARIFFSDIIQRVGGKGLHPSTSLALPTTDHGDHGHGFDERDKAWVRRCHALPFSGQFLFHVCMWLLDAKAAAVPAATSAVARPRLLDVVQENIEKNDLAIRAVRIPPQSAQAIGKSDPLETHVKAFSCGHCFPKRVFDEDVVPEFEKRMTTLPTPLFATKQLLLSEFKRSHVDAPCPVCAFNKISATVFAQHRRQHDPPQDEVSTSTTHDYYFLHQSEGASSTTAAPQLQQLQHDEWEWRGAAAAS